MKVLVTGGAGRLGAVVCKELLRIGHDVLVTDQRHAAHLPGEVPQRLANLCDSHAVYPLLQGRDAVVHLGNIPNLGLGPSPQEVLSRNVAMNVNVFRAAADLGVRRIVFASSIQTMIRLEEGRTADSPHGIQRTLSLLALAERPQCLRHRKLRIGIDRLNQIQQVSEVVTNETTATDKGDRLRQSERRLADHRSGSGLVL